MRATRVSPRYNSQLARPTACCDNFGGDGSSTPDHFEVEYALRGIDKPVGVLTYELTRKLPPELHNKLPEASLLEEEIRKEMMILISPIESNKVSKTDR